MAPMLFSHFCILMLRGVVFNQMSMQIIFSYHCRFSFCCLWACSCHTHIAPPKRGRYWKILGFQNPNNHNPYCVGILIGFGIGLGLGFNWVCRHFNWVRFWLQGLWIKVYDMTAVIWAGEFFFNQLEGVRPPGPLKYMSAPSRYTFG